MRHESREAVGRSWNRDSRTGFTLIELLAVIAIIAILAGLLIVVAEAAQRRARLDRTNAIIDVLATACSSYSVQERNLPYPVPDYVGLDALQSFPKYYANGDWTPEAFNVALVYVLSQPRQTGAFLDTSKDWFQKIQEDVPGPDGRILYRIIDGFKTPLRVQRLDSINKSEGATTSTILDPSGIANFPQNAFIKLLSAGPDEKFGTDPNDPNGKESKDNVIKEIRR